jgi:hypothetical protein
MKASIGDWLVVEGVHIGERRRCGQVTEVRGDEGEPPFVVHWQDDDRETLFFPREGTHVVPPDEIDRYSASAG